jgi:hypothetical protein
MSAKQFREFARECMRWADESASEEDRHHFVDMAKAWVQAAAEHRELSQYPEPPPLKPSPRRKGNGARNIRLRTQLM